MAALLEAESKPDYVAPLSIFHLEKGLRETYEEFDGDIEAYEIKHLSDYEDEMICELYNTEYVSTVDKSYGGILLYGTIPNSGMPNRNSRIVSFNPDYTLLDTGGNDAVALEFGVNLTEALTLVDDTGFKKAVIEFFVKNTTYIEYNTVSKRRKKDFNYYITEKTNLF